MGSPITPFLSPSTHGSPSSLSARTDNRSDLTQMPNRVVRSLFKEDGTSPSENPGSSVPSSSRSDAQLGSSIEKQLASENELIVNEFLHEQSGFVDTFSVTDEDQNNIKVCAVFIIMVICGRRTRHSESSLGFLALLQACTTVTMG